MSANSIENENQKLDNDPSRTIEPQGESPREDEEFKITVKKLEIPVRPRGVLAE